MLAAIEGSGFAYPTLLQVPIYCFNPEASEKEERAGGVGVCRGCFHASWVTPEHP